MASGMTSLDAVVQEYLQDTEFQQLRQAINQQRAKSIPHYRDIVHRFIDGTITLNGFRNALKTLYQDKFWGASGPGFLMEFNRLADNHTLTNSDIEANFRFILRDLNTQNIGQRIEQFYHLLTQEKQRMHAQNLSNKKSASPGNSAFIISLLALWLNYPAELYVCYPSLRTGLQALFTAKLLLTPVDIQFNKSIDIKSEADYRAITSIIDTLAASQPGLKSLEYWAGHFFVWITERLKENPAFLKNVIVIFEEAKNEDDESPVDIDDENLLPLLSTVEDQPLKPTPEPLLTQLIAELRRHILIDESVVRDIYHALLGGHLILTGPPGTGKTQLARLIPEILWQSEEIIENANGSSEPPTKHMTTHTAYTTTLVTATADWSTRTLISSIMPIVLEGKVFYHTQYGHLVQAILSNWSTNPLQPEYWEKAQRMRIGAKSLSSGQPEEFRGHWLIIDEFNRAPIDIALGEAMTALSSGDALQLLIAGKPIKLPLPKDFRIIGTLNNFDRHYLNQISEALKRRFTFVEILPPSRVHRQAEQEMILFKALKEIAHISNKIEGDETTVEWWRAVSISSDASGTYHDKWNDEDHSLRKVFYDIAWPLYEVIRIYRQLGTAQAIALTRQVLIRGILEGYYQQEQWQAALDTAFSNVIANQLQALLSDELDVLLWHLKLDKEAFIQKYQNFISELGMKRRRLAAHLEALHRIVNNQGEPLLSDEAIERLLDEEEELSIIIPELLTPELLTEAFHLDHLSYKLPQFMRRLRTFKAEHGL